MTTQNNFEWLRSTNIEIGNAETQGNKAFFEALLAPCLAFRRATGQVVDRPAFIAGISPSAKRTTSIQSITLLENNRALVECTVTMEADGGAKRFHNVRLFVREGPSKPWKLLAWANEPIP
jgi:hypothetical protein